MSNFEGFGEELKKSLKSSVVVGSVSGAVLTLMKSRAILKNCAVEKYRNFLRKNVNFNEEDKKAAQTLTGAEKRKALFGYWIKFPSFFVSYNIMFKTVSRGLGVFRKPLHLSMVAFVSGVIAQRFVGNIFSWNWSIYFFMRVFLHYLRFRLPYLKEIPNERLHLFIHGVYIYLLAYYSMYTDSEMLANFRDIVGMTPHTYHVMYGGHRHAQTVSCYDVEHLKNTHKSCLQSFLHDGCVRYIKAFKVFFKFYLIVNNLKYFIASRANPTDKSWDQVGKEVTRMVLGATFNSTNYWVFAAHCGSRVICMYQFLLWVFYRQIQKKKTPIAQNNALAFAVVNAFIGYIAIRFESDERRYDISLFLVYKIIEQIVRINCDVHHDETSDAHPILGNPNLPSLFVGLMVSTIVYLHQQDPEAIPGLDARLCNVFV